MKILINSLLKLIDEAKLLGLNDHDLNNAIDFLSHHEFGLCFETITAQMYEYGIEIDNNFYELIIKIGSGMNLEQDSYSFMKELKKI